MHGAGTGRRHVAVGVAYVSKIFFRTDRPGDSARRFGARGIGATLTILGSTSLVTRREHGLGGGGANLGRLPRCARGRSSTSLPRKSPTLARAARACGRPPSMLKQLEALQNIQVWRFSLYYFFVFGGFVGHRFGCRAISLVHTISISRPLALSPSRSRRRWSLPNLRRSSRRPVWRAPSDVLDLPGRGRGRLPVLTIRPRTTSSMV